MGQRTVADHNHFWLMKGWVRWGREGQWGRISKHSCRQRETSHYQEKGKFISRERFRSTRSWQKPRASPIYRHWPKVSQNLGLALTMHRWVSTQWPHWCWTFKSALMLWSIHWVLKAKKERLLKTVKKKRDVSHKLQIKKKTANKKTTVLSMTTTRSTCFTWRANLWWLS